MAARKTSTFWYLFSRFWFWITGWRLGTQVAPGVKKSMMIAAPHTSNWDFMYARAAFFLMDVDVKLTIKREWVDIPLLGKLMQSLGGIAVDRSKNNSLVDGMAQLFKEHDELVILITPEGTRAYQPKWRKGFYHTAMQAGVPIQLGYLDYKNKEAGVGPCIYPTGDYEADLEIIKAFYRTKAGRFPERGVR